MRCSSPIYLPSDGARPGGVGFDVAPALPGFPQLVRATLRLDESDDAVRALQFLHATTVIESDQDARIARVTPASPPLGAPFRAIKGARVAELSFDLGDLFSELPSRPFFLHLSSGRLLSQPQRREPGEGRPQSLAETARAPLAQLVAAYALCRAGEHARAVPVFRAALEHEEVRADLDRPHLYNAACAASASAASIADAGARDRQLREAAAWLDEDERRSGERLLALWKKIAATPAEPQRARLAAQRAAISDHIDARAADPDLAAVRGLSFWKARGNADR
jgi:hypothetical protein